MGGKEIENAEENEIRGVSGCCGKQRETRLTLWQRVRVRRREGREDSRDGWLPPLFSSLRLSLFFPFISPFSPAITELDIQAIMMEQERRDKERNSSTS
jgi:hypothetical protein